MKRPIVLAMAAVILSTCGGRWCAQSAPASQTIKAPDDRMKADILVVVAHPDDEGGVTPYLARAIYDEHKRVAVVFLTRGGSGGNDYSREHGPALADIREQEARAACAKLGITNVWFLLGKDTASQNVLNSLANWGHGANLEALVRIVRLTQPEVIITWLPGVFIGENHGDHQAAGVLATEAFDLAGDPTAFPAQVAGATKRLEVYLENLTLWQPKKLYYFSDADDQKQFAGTGPAYSIREVSPSQKKPYWRLAIEAATPHLTQFPDVQQLQKMTEEQLNKFFEDPKNMFWPDPMTLIFGKTAFGGAETRTMDVFGGERNAPLPNQAPKIKVPNAANLPPGQTVESLPTYSGPSDGWVEIGGVWAFYKAFLAGHAISRFSSVKLELAVKSGSVVSIPFRLVPAHPDSRVVSISAELPSGWRVVSGDGSFEIPGNGPTELRVDVQTPELSKEALQNQKPVPITLHLTTHGQNFGEIGLHVLLKGNALPQN
jgi:LmbE family N-acetylglucosaminyl deacetylase